MEENTTIIIPTKNEKESIAEVISKIKSVGDYDILIVDKSEDGTAEIAKKLGARVIKQKGIGKGDAMLLGAKYARENIIFVDGDMSYEIEKIPEMIKFSEQYDIIRGIRIPLNICGLDRFLFNSLMSFLVSMICKKPVKDLFTGFFLIKKEHFLNLHLQSKGFEIETEIFVKACKNNLRMTEIKTRYSCRRGKSKVKLLDAIKIFLTIIKCC